MKKKAFSKIFMITAGLLTAAIILFSQSFYHGAEVNKKKDSDAKAKSEKVVISATSDAVTSNTLVKLNDNGAPSIQPSFSITEIKSLFKVESRLFVNFFRTLFRFVIAPNAP